jgi:hypothetical protein
MLGLGAHAGSVVLDFSGPDGPVTTPSTNVLTRSAGGFTATASGFNADGTALQLYTKNDAGDEKGVGFASTDDHELTLTGSGRAPANFIQIDVSQFYHSTPGGSITMRSVSGTESFNLFGTNTAGTLPGTPLNATPFGSAFDGTPVAVPQWGTYKYIDVAVAPDRRNPDDNVLFGAITVAQAVPEPASLVMVSISSLIGLGCWLRRRSRAIA